MPRRAAATAAAFAVWLPTAGPAAAEVVAASPTRFEIRHSVDSARAPDRAWARLVRIQDWWSGAHTRSGDARNLRLEATAGGCWCERWVQAGAARRAATSVSHGRVLWAEPGRLLRIEGAFGPMQEMGLTGIMSFRIEPREAGSRIVVTYLVTGPPDAPLAALAPAVDGVMGEAAMRLAGP